MGDKRMWFYNQYEEIGTIQQALRVGYIRFFSAYAQLNMTARSLY